MFGSGQVDAPPSMPGDANHDSAAAPLCEANCAARHGERGRGGLLNDAPSPADADAVMEALRRGRRGVMPA